jgi:YegS/Rv2252/BmrU family lipid kinase
MPNATIIFNPRAGKVTLSPLVASVADLWRSCGWRVTVVPTAGPGHAAELARQAAEAGEDLVMAAGGDGTLGQVANGLAHSNTIMAPLPVGTANSFAQELQIPRPQLLDPRAVLRAAGAQLAGRVQRVDLGYTEAGTAASHWLLWCGIGADSFVVERMEPRPQWSRRLGAWGYSLQMATLLPGLPAMHAVVEVDGEQIEDDFLLIVISNSRRYGGGMIPLNPGALLDDGWQEVWFFRAGAPAGRLAPSQRVARMARYMTEAKLERHTRDPAITMIPGRRVRISAEPAMPFHTDGDTEAYTPFSSVLRPRALRLLVPSYTPADLFEHPGVPLSDAI